MLHFLVSSNDEVTPKKVVVTTLESVIDGSGNGDFDDVSDIIGI